MLASRVLITAGTPGHMYLDDRQAKCLERKAQGMLDEDLGHLFVTEERFFSKQRGSTGPCLYLISLRNQLVFS